MSFKEIPLDHSTSQAVVLVQLTKPSSSICFTMFKTRSVASNLPCGNKANWDTLAPSNNIAEEFLQVTTQAPQPIQVVASKALSASALFTGVAFASIVFPDVFTDINPPACCTRSKALLSTIKSFTVDYFLFKGFFVVIMLIPSKKNLYRQVI